MPIISSYALQYSNVDFSTISASTFDLFITEADADNSPSIAPQLTDAEVEALTGQGRSVVGYVNVAVTDANRAYWQDGWTSAGPHPRHEDDLNPVAATAPSWLQSQPTNGFGIIVDFTDPQWQAIVINQAVALVQRGYSGVFLDDVAAYYALGAPGGEAGIRQMANAMCEFVAAIEAAISAENPDAYVVVNSDPYLHTNVTADAAGAEAAAGYLAAVDAHLLENKDAAALDYAQTSLVGETRLILESDGSPAYSYAESWARGILYTAPDQDYDALGTFAYPATNGDDILSGGDGPNQIAGLGGNDTLNGGEAADRLTGGAGDDLYIVDVAGDVVVEAAGEGTDTVRSRASYVLPANVEHLTLYGGATVNATGNSLGNTLTGNDAPNILNGGTGADVMSGGLGHDTYVVDNVGDVVIESGSSGNDKVESSVDFSLPTHLEKLVLTGTSGTEGRGNSGANTLTGNGGGNFLNGGAGDDTIDGGAGADRIYGSEGDDVLKGGTGADRFMFNTAPGTGNVDAISDFSVTDDLIYIARYAFANLPANGMLAASAFCQGNAAADASDRIVYDLATGKIFYDSDGTGAAAQILFATVTAGTALTSADFVVYG